MQIFSNHLLQIQQACDTLSSVGICEVVFIFGLCCFQSHFLAYMKTRTNIKRKKATVTWASVAEASLENDWNWMGVAIIYNWYGLIISRYLWDAAFWSSKTHGMLEFWRESAALLFLQAKHGGESAAYLWQRITGESHRWLLVNWEDAASLT